MPTPPTSPATSKRPGRPRLADETRVVGVVCPVDLYDWLVMEAVRRTEAEGKAVAPSAVLRAAAVEKRRRMAGWTVRAGAET